MCIFSKHSKQVLEVRIEFKVFTRCYSSSIRYQCITNNLQNIKFTSLPKNFDVPLI